MFTMVGSAPVQHCCVHFPLIAYVDVDKLQQTGAVSIAMMWLKCQNNMCCKSCWHVTTLVTWPQVLLKGQGRYHVDISLRTALLLQCALPHSATSMIGSMNRAADCRIL